jgi:hypothetical protein
MEQTSCPGECSSITDQLPINLASVVFRITLAFKVPSYFTRYGMSLESYAQTR